jgi:hypothetical protein
MPIFNIPLNRFDNEIYIKDRVDKAPEEAKGCLRTALKYLYITNGPTNLMLDRYKVAKDYLETTEDILVRWLKTRTNGKLRNSYGKNALIAARNSKYRCEECGFEDIRTLNLDHIHGKGSKSFKCLCANCHTIKSREKDWLGK